MCNCPTDGSVTCDHLDNETVLKVQCDNCGWTGNESELHKTLGEIHKLAQRLDPGGLVPVGTCPAEDEDGELCDSFCYYIPEPRHQAETIIDLGIMNDEGAALFKQQRALLSTLDTRGILTGEESELIEGLMNLCDQIADELHDRYGFNTLFRSNDDGNCSACGYTMGDDDICARDNCPSHANESDD